MRRAEPPPQPQMPITAAIARAIALGWNLTFRSNLARPIVRGHCMISSLSRFLSRLAQVARETGAKWIELPWWESGLCLFFI